MISEAVGTPCRDTKRARGCAARLALLVCVIAITTAGCDATAPTDRDGAAPLSQPYHLNIVVNDFAKSDSRAIAALGPTFTHHVRAVLARLGVHGTMNVTASRPGQLAGVADAVDVIWSNPAAVAEAMQRFNYTAIASMENMKLGHAQSKFGGVFITHDGPSHAHIRTEDDCAREPLSIAAISRKGFGGFLMHLKHLMERGAATKELLHHPGIIETGSQPAVVALANAGNITCGFIRTHILESTPPEGRAHIRILGQRHDTAAALFPFNVSTRFWPEWSVAVHPRVPRELASLVKEALLALRSPSPATDAGGFSRFFPPVSHEPILELLWETGALQRPPTPTPEQTGERVSLATQAVVAAACAIFAVAAAAAVVRLFRRRDPLAHAPQDPTRPVAVAYVAVSSLTALRTVDPAGADELLRRLSKTVRGACARNNVYEGPPAGDALMLCTHDAVALVRTCDTIRAEFDASVWNRNAAQLHRRSVARGRLPSTCGIGSVDPKIPHAPGESPDSTPRRHRRKTRAGSVVAARDVGVRIGLHVGRCVIDRDEEAIALGTGVMLRFTGDATEAAGLATDAATAHEIVMTRPVRDVVMSTAPDLKSRIAGTPRTVDDASDELTKIDCFTLVTPQALAAMQAANASEGSSLSNSARSSEASIGSSLGGSARLGRNRSFGGDAIDSVCAAAGAAHGHLVKKRVTVVVVHMECDAFTSRTTARAATVDVKARVNTLLRELHDCGGAVLCWRGDDATFTFNAHEPSLNQVLDALRFVHALPNALEGQHGVKRVTCGVATGVAFVGHAAPEGDGKHGPPVVVGRCVDDAVAAEAAIRGLAGIDKALSCGVPADHPDAGTLFSHIALAPLYPAPARVAPAAATARAARRSSGLVRFEDGAFVVNHPVRLVGAVVQTGDAEDDGEWLYKFNTASKKFESLNSAVAEYWALPVHERRADAVSEAIVSLTLGEDGSSAEVPPALEAGLRAIERTMCIGRSTTLNASIEAPRFRGEARVPLRRHDEGEPSPAVVLGDE